jgi:hypothetical protein
MAVHLELHLDANSAIIKLNNLSANRWTDVGLIIYPTT